MSFGEQLSGGGATGIGTDLIHAFEHPFKSAHEQINQIFRLRAVSVN